MLLLHALALAGSPLVDGPWSHETVTAGELDVHLLVAGPVDAPAVVLLHGFPDSSHGWRTVLPLLSEDHRVYAPDLRGYGATSAPADGYDLDTLRGDVIALFDALDLETAHLIGHDWGAAITWEVAAHHPDRLETATVLAVPHLAALQQTWELESQQRAYKRFANAMTWRITPWVLARISEESRADVYHPELVDDDAMSAADQAQYHALFDERAETRPPLAYYRENFGSWREVWKRAEAAPPSGVPTLVLWGEQDAYMMPSNAERSCAFVEARCEAAVHPDAAHWLQWEQGPWVVERWRAFIADEPGDTPPG